jgi:hypothetical protein
MKPHGPIVILSFLLWLPSASAEPAQPGAAQPKARVRQDTSAVPRLLQSFGDEPTVDAVQRAAARRASAEPDLARSWLRRVRRAGWLPEFQAGTSIDGRTDRGLDRETGTADRLSVGRQRQISYDLKLSWDLSRLIFDPNELKVSREAQRIAELRDQVVTHVTRLYFERRRLQILERLRPASTVRAALERGLRLAELTATLDALTGGLFRQARRERRPGRAP